MRLRYYRSKVICRSKVQLGTDVLSSHKRITHLMASYFKSFDTLNLKKQGKIPQNSILKDPESRNVYDKWRRSGLKISFELVFDHPCIESNQQ